MKLYIIRHGQTTWNVGGRMQGSKNSNLTDIGKLNATKLGESLKDT
ncbi:MAG: histidine phosphatase family protein, partial [Paraclostridium sp.]